MKLHILRQKAARLNKGKKAPKTKQRPHVNQKEARQVDMEAPVEETSLRERPETEGPEIQPSYPCLSTWNNNHIRNMRECRLLQLPEELLVNIMRKTPPHVLYMLRQTCFTFFRLFQDSAFKAAHIIQKIRGRHLICFNLNYRTPGGLYGWFCRLVPRVARMNWCEDCYVAKTKNSKNAWWRWNDDYTCRLSELDGTKCGDRHCIVCIREVRSCEDRYCLACRRYYPLLDFPDYSSKCFLHHSFRVSSCPHRSYSMREFEHRQKRLLDDYSIQMKFVKCERCAKRCDTGVPAAREHSRIVPPSISIISRTVLFEWTLPVFTLGEDPVTDTFLLDRLNEFGERHGRGLLCPHFDFRGLLQCFDPRVCSCLGMDLRISGSSTRASSMPGSNGESIPTCNAASAQTAEGSFIPASWENGLEQHSVSCEHCSTVYHWARDGGVVFLGRRSRALWEDVMTCMEDVVHRIDQASYDATQGYRSKNVLWCWDDRCRNGRDWACWTKRLTAGIP
ncbi:hypothetical protein CGCSCA1_v010058 [Colletotrichum siamense]|nr:hypothetical protein CGCSCA1_v010058 [Colletotrichum siamense]